MSHFPRRVGFFRLGSCNPTASQYDDNKYSINPDSERRSRQAASRATSLSSGLMRNFNSALFLIGPQCRHNGGPSTRGASTRIVQNAHLIGSTCRREKISTKLPCDGWHAWLFPTHD